MKKILALILLTLSLQIAAADFKLIPLDGSRGGELGCKNEANNAGELFYHDYKVFNGTVSLVKAKEYYSKNSVLASAEEIRNYNGMRNEHLDRVYKDKYKNKQESVDDFYQKCRTSQWSQMLDRQK